MPFVAGSVPAWSGDDTRRVLRVPGPDSDKRSRGVVALRTGSDAFPGAAVLGVEGAWRVGAGYVCYIGARRAADLVLARRPETVVTDVARADDRSVRVGSRLVGARVLGGARAHAWVVGSGTDAATRDEAETLRALLSGADPVVVDAGALDLLFAAGPAAGLAAAAAPVIATPHAGEFARLRVGLGLSPLDRDRMQDPAARAAAVQETANALGGTVLLKGATTLIADPDAAGPGVAHVIAVDAGTSWLATAGTGDVLAGAIGALIAADRVAGGLTSLADLAAAATWLHGMAARLASDAHGGGPGHPIVALDVAEALPRAVAIALAHDENDAERDDETEEDPA